MNTMCEWLTCGDWCDVRLMCGGHFFNAHRAVLASVSSFLRKMLLSCPLDESPLFIFLPEFDLDALSSVLCYIYNGEVLIPNHKVKMFLDIANAMEIFIDQKYILQIDDNKQYGFGHKGDTKLLAKDNYNICQLKLCNGKSGCFINDRKSTRNEKLNHQEPIVSLKACDKAIQTFKWSEEQIPDLGNLTSVSRYRQRQSFLRDIFIETFSQDGNVNGQKPGVLAISNEEYRIPSTALFSNAMEHYPSESKTLADMHKKLLEQYNPASFDYLQQLNDKDYKIRNKSNINLSYTVYNQMVNNFNAECVVENGLKKEHDIDLWKTCTPLETSLPLLSRNSSNFPIETQNSFLNLEDTSGVKSSEIPKATIMNEVLQNPWLPRQPQSYRPFPKKDLNSTNIEKNYENKASVSNKDNNNNSDTAMETKYEKEIDEPVSSEQQDLRCIVCQEAFTRKQDYTIHMRRHSSINRYSCGECYKTFSQLRNFKYHMSVHRGTKEFAATCSVCGKHFNDRGYLSNHMKIHRNRKEYKCASCPKSFNQRVAFNMHIRIHTGVKPHVCEECGKAFSRKMLLKQHQRTHSGERPYACAHCGKRFADRSNMTLHLRLHTGEKPFSCTLCKKSFTKKHHLKSHLNFHTGAKPYSCPRCNLAFTQSSNMRTHYKKCNVTS